MTSPATGTDAYPADITAADRYLYTVHVYKRWSQAAGAFIAFLVTAACVLAVTVRAVPWVLVTAVAAVSLVSVAGSLVLGRTRVRALTALLRVVSREDLAVMVDPVELAERVAARREQLVRCACTPEQRARKPRPGEAAGCGTFNHPYQVDYSGGEG